MTDDELKAIFDQQAPRYDQQWAKTALIREGLQLLVEAVFGDLPTHARILCVGSGTGEEIAHLASHFPHFRFVAVEPSGPMLEVCRSKADERGFLSRCDFHEGYLDALPPTEPFDAAT